MNTPARIGRLGVIGDVHAEDGRLALALAHLANAGIDAIICTGDVVDGIGCPSKSLDLLRQHNVHTVRGNHDRWLLEDRLRHLPNAHARQDLSAADLAYLASLPSSLALETLAGRLLLCHGVGDDDLKKIWPGTSRMPMEQSTRLDSLIGTGDYRFVINGHMHFRTMMQFETLTLINAGTLKGEQWPGFMLIDFASAALTAFGFRETGIETVAQVPLDPVPGQARWSDTQDFDGQWQPLVLH